MVINNNNVACCLCVRNCESYLTDIFKNLDLLSNEFLQFNVIFVYNDCSDNSEQLLQTYKNSKNFNVILINFTSNNSSFRTVRIANARNLCIDIIYNQLKNIDFHFMIDADDVNISPWNIQLIKKYINEDTWDSISFNREYYYDIWALLFKNYKHHAWGYCHPNAGCVITLMKKDIKKSLKNLESEIDLLDCYSAFNGFAIYRTEKFKNIKYDGIYSNIKQFISENDKQHTLEYIQNRIPINIKINENCFELCEHLYYHLSAIKFNNCRIRISKYCL
jgi:hypothetical protein